MSITAITDLITPPGRRRQVDWAALEALAGSGVPDDYKQLVELYGPGLFSDFISVQQPFDEFPEHDLLAQRDHWRWVLRELEPGETHPHDPADLFAWATTLNGDAFYWVCSSADPNEWTVTVNEARDAIWFDFDGDATTFLAGVMTGAVDVEIFPADEFFTDPPSFTLPV